MKQKEMEIVLGLTVLSLGEVEVPLSLVVYPPQRRWACARSKA